MASVTRDTPDRPDDEDADERREGVERGDRGEDSPDTTVSQDQTGHAQEVYHYLVKRTSPECSSALGGTYLEDTARDEISQTKMESIVKVDPEVGKVDGNDVEEQSIKLKDAAERVPVSGTERQNIDDVSGNVSEIVFKDAKQKESTGDATTRVEKVYPNNVEEQDNKLMDVTESPKVSTIIDGIDDEVYPTVFQADYTDTSLKESTEVTEDDHSGIEKQGIKLRDVTESHKVSTIIDGIDDEVYPTVFQGDYTDTSLKESTEGASTRNTEDDHSGIEKQGIKLRDVTESDQVPSTDMEDIEDVSSSVSELDSADTSHRDNSEAASSRVTKLDGSQIEEPGVTCIDVIESNGEVEEIDEEDDAPIDDRAESCDHVNIVMISGLQTKKGAKRISRKRGKKNEDHRFSNIASKCQQQMRDTDFRLFVETRAFLKAKECLQNRGIVVIIGGAGMGKTMMGIKLMSSCAEEESRIPVTLTHHSEWNDIPLGEEKKYGKNQSTNKEQYVVMVDDMFGRSNLVKDFQFSWEQKLQDMHCFVERNRVKLILVFRYEIFNACKSGLRDYAVFSKFHLIDLQSSECSLSTSEKTEILEKHVKQTGVKMTTEEISSAVKHSCTKLGFPQCCNFFVNSRDARERGEHFFDNPIEFLEEQFTKLKDTNSKDAQYHYLTLLLIMFNQGSLRYDSLDPFEDTYGDTIQQIGKLRHICRINSDVSLGQVEASAESLCELYLKKDEATKSYTFNHQSVFETLLLHFSRRYQKQGIRMCPIPMLLLYFVTSGSPNKGNIHIEVMEENYKTLAERLMEAMIKEKSNAGYILEHQSFKDEHFVNYLTKTFWNQSKPLDILSQRLVFSDQTIISLFHEKLMFEKIWSHSENTYYSSADVSTKERKHMVLQMVHVASYNTIRICSITSITSVAIQKTLLALAKYFVSVLDSLSLEDAKRQKQEALSCSCYIGNTELISMLLNIGAVPSVDAISALCASGVAETRAFLVLAEHYQAPAMPFRVTSKLLTLALEKGSGDVAVQLIYCAVRLPEAEQILTRAVKQLLLQSHEGFRKEVFDVVHVLRNRTVMECEVRLPSSEDINASRMLEEIMSFRSDYMPRSYVFFAAACNTSSILEFILSKNFHFLESLDKNRNTLLHTASRYGCSESVQYLINFGCSVNAVNNHKETCLHLAAKNNSNVVLCLLENKADVNVLDKRHESPLHVAARFNSFQTVTHLLEFGGNIQLNIQNNASPIHTAARYSSVEIVRCMLSKLTEEEQNTLQSLLSIAMHYNDAEVIEFLVRKVQNLQFTCTVMYQGFERHPLTSSMHVISSLFARGLDPSTDICQVLLHRLTRVANITAVENLVSRGVDPNREDSENRTPVHIASCYSMTAILDELLSVIRMDVDGISKQSRSFYANDEIRNVLVACGASPHLPHARKLAMMSDAETMKHVQELTAMGFALSGENEPAESLLMMVDTAMYTVFTLTRLLIDQDQLSPMTIASLLGDTNTVRQLIRSGVNKDVQGVYWYTPLMLATSLKRLDTMRYLLGQKANLYLIDSLGLTAMHMAAMYGCTDALNIMINNGADPNCCDLDYKTPLYHACWKGKLENIRLLISNGALLDVHLTSSSDLLQGAVISQHIECIEELLNLGLDVNSVDKDQRTALSYACTIQDIAVVGLLLKHGADPNKIHGVHEYNELHEAAIRECPDILELLLEHGGDPYVQDSKGNSLFHCVVDAKQAQIDSQLLKIVWGFTLKKKLQSLFITNPLLAHFVGEALKTNSGPLDNKTVKRSEDGYKKVIAILQVKRCDINHRNNDGETALFVSVRNGHVDKTRTLLACGANPAIINYHGDSILHCAVEEVHPEIVSLLIGSETMMRKKNLKNKRGLTALEMATNRSEELDDDMKNIRYTQIISLLQDH